ncbi:hypothetical protein H8356DRAFT_1062895 [Neocallimastix lanati (nom. inval.)]|jgi:KaiC/GvpD/RAD55 family RecA-like ATPase|uniref:Elongator complex protein 6 n=1 Tax=Neocallimastix californiae TaxID=1754190 RepID=A0A1Y2ALX6_9FUNG|nr:hypothetical protein H8356DRAFT_1062895 [Neocallimastix sp. JGI-2020a]ORY23492.1 hypothetical protein LY90DRAFT_675512 [Neocallimastix californiae]|eukprot:ORY23492.1 hypothetical protein LY90DRAFT_675512 [Neocallimastix californiae]
MYIQIDSVIPNQNGKSILIADTVFADASFLINHYLSKSIKDKEGNVILISFFNNFTQYESIQKKMGNNLKLYKDSEKLNFIDGSIISQTENVTLNNIYNKIEELLNETSFTSTTIILDDITHLLYIEYPINEILNFEYKCRNLCNKYNCNFIVKIHKDIGDDKDSDPISINHNYLLNYLINNYEYIIETNELESGFTDDIQGQLSFARGVSCTNYDFNPRLYHYKINENPSFSKFYAKGLIEGTV